MWSRASPSDWVHFGEDGRAMICASDCVVFKFAMDLDECGTSFDTSML